MSNRVLEYTTQIRSQDGEDLITVDVVADLCLERGPFYRKAEFKAYKNGDEYHLTASQRSELNEELQIREFGRL